MRAGKARTVEWGERSLGTQRPLRARALATGHLLVLSGVGRIRALAHAVLPKRVRQGLGPVYAWLLDALRSSEGAQGGDADWEDYAVLTRRIRTLARARLRRVGARPPQLISLRVQDLSTAAGSLRFARPEAPQVSIVIPVYGNAKLTVECLSSILRNTRDVSYEVLVVDDGSDDAVADVLRRVDNITYLRNAQRLGFVLSCNAAAERARGEFLLLLNNDVQVTPNWLAPLVRTFSAFDQVGAVGPKIVFPDGRLQEAGAHINRDASTTLIGAFDDPSRPRYRYIREVDCVSGVCLLVRSEVFRKLGGFDPGFAPAYCEDMDLCLRLRDMGMRVFCNPESVIVHHLSATSDLEPGYKQRYVVQNQQRLSVKWQRRLEELNRVRLIAFYLPQFHPIPENDRWWGKGFTEWVNVAKARPNFRGHYQPHLPADLGFYDLRVEDVMEQQAELAKRYGLHGFCFYYYWFRSTRLLEMPLERMLETGKPRIPFCLCWANENWTRRWDGREDDVLIAQQHSEDDDRAVAQDLARYMKHPQYVRVNGRPLLLIYRVDVFPDIKRSTEVWRDVCRRAGVGEIYLAMVESFGLARGGVYPGRYGFDASVEFPPHEMSAPTRRPRLLNPHYRGTVSDYREIVVKYLQKDVPDHVRFRAVFPGWDNTPRQQDRAFIFAHASPGGYQAWLEAILEQTRQQNFGDERLVFINAWNEWGEGAHLEPDRRFGHGFLEATRNALEAWLLSGDVRD